MQIKPGQEAGFNFHSPIFPTVKGACQGALPFFTPLSGPNAIYNFFTPNPEDIFFA